MKLKVKYNRVQDIKLEDFINDEYKLYCLEDDSKLTKQARELKYAWLVIIERLKLYGLLKEADE